MNQPHFTTAFENYLKLVNEADPLEALNNQQPIIDEYFDAIPEAKADFRYAAGKWSLKEMVQHLIDTERIMAYRALAFARGEKINLPGFDENEYAGNSFAANREWKELLAELKTVRLATLQLYRSFHPSVINNMGSANGREITPGILALVMVGHIYHHRNIIEERYKPMFD